MFQIRVKEHIDAAHYIKGYEGKCSREHGHRWDIEVCLQSKKLDDLNMVLDFKLIKHSLARILEQLDHYQLNEVLKEECVTAEFLAQWIYYELPAAIDKVELISVEVWESPECSVKFSEEKGVGNAKERV